MRSDQHIEVNSKQKREDKMKYDELLDSQAYLCPPGMTLQICDSIGGCTDAVIGFRCDEDTFKLSEQFENLQSQDIE